MDTRSVARPRSITIPPQGCGETLVNCRAGVIMIDAVAPLISERMAWPAQDSQQAVMIYTKSVSSTIDLEHDGLRILATRFRGRGLSKARYDVWMPSLGPSETLLRDMQTGRIPWPEFIRGYRAELFADGAIDADNQTIKNHGQKFTLRLIKTLAAHAPVTLMCHCAEDQQQCHRHELARLLASKRI